MAEKELKIVYFDLADEDYGLDVNQVLGVNPLIEITHIQKAPDFVEGVITIKGKIIPVMDLRRRLGIEEVTEDTEKIQEKKRKRIIVTKIRGMRIGFIVDNVYKVMDIPQDSIEPPSEALDHSSLLKGVGRLDKGLLLLLDLDKIIGPEDEKILSDVHDKTKT